MTSSQWSTSIVVGQMIMWMLLLTVKHVVADFLPVKTWLAAGTVGAGGRLEPLTVHCLIHGVLATLLFVLLAPKLWFLGIVDFRRSHDNRSHQRIVWVEIGEALRSPVFLVVARHRQGFASFDGFRVGADSRQQHIKCLARQSGRRDD
jgi:hypothetical protein